MQTDKEIDFRGQTGALGVRGSYGLKWANRVLGWANRVLWWAKKSNVGKNPNLFRASSVFSRFVRGYFILHKKRWVGKKIANENAYPIQNPGDAPGP